MGRSRREWRDLAKIRARRILRQRRYCSMRQLEKKISEAGPADMRPDPLILSEAKDELLGDGEIKREPVKGLPEFYTPADFDVAKRADARRRDQILGLYRKFAKLHKTGRIGKALEWVVYNAALEAAPSKFAVLGSPERVIGEGTPISGKGVGRPPDLLLIGCGGGGYVVDVEAKNLREWLSASSQEVWSLIGRAVRMEAVPFLVTRKIRYPAYYVFQMIGLLAFQTHFQFFPPEMEEEVIEIRHKDGLGFSDIRCSLDPPPTLVRYFSEHLPRLVPSALERFLGHREILRRYAIDLELERKIEPGRRSELYGEFERKVLEREGEYPDVWE